MDIKEYLVIETDGKEYYLIGGHLIAQGNKDQLLDAVSGYDSKKILFGYKDPFPTFQALPAMIILNEYGYEYYVLAADGSLEQLSLSVD